MERRLSWLACLTLAVGVSPTFAGDKVITVGDKAVEVSTEVKDTDPEVSIKGVLSLPAKEFRVKMEAGKTYTIALNTTAAGFDPFLVVQDKAGELLALDDDGGGMLNSLLKFAPRVTGEYKVFAASLAKNSGPVVMRIEAGPGPMVKKIKVGDTVNGALNAGGLQQFFDVDLEAGKTYQFDLKSGDFDALLFLESKEGKKLAVNDDGPGTGLDSQITHRITEPGTYRLIATSLSMRQTGNFSISVSPK